MGALDCARDAMSAANSEVIRAENAGDPDALTRALAAQDRAEAHLKRMEEVDARVGGTQ